MQPKDISPKQPKLPESAQVYDYSEHKLVTAYRKDFKRHDVITLIDAVTYNAVTTTFTGSSYEIPAYYKALILINLTVTLAPTDILISIEFSDDNINWYKYMLGPFGDLRYEDAAGNKTECLSMPLIAKYMRGKAVATGTSGTALFKLTLKAILTS